ncbi:cardiolipin synthase [Comamonas serinivorans]|uniref:Cardiolipin synthase n=1 Tax=Comamonas serinivorans TaxID=1082851 RepID=A0A1Y0EM12_9BURK|nr:cardiolipin synthase [Comamonas serinivorans]ARU04448.1 cardiolipin synthase [Comamonas serinivorans]
MPTGLNGLQVSLGQLWTLFLFLVHLGVVARALTRPNRSPASRVAWVAVVMLLPVVGVLAYLLLGETSVGWARVRRLRRTASQLRLTDETGVDPEQVPAKLRSLFDLGRSINGFHAVAGNRITLLGDAEATPSEPTRHVRAAMNQLIADIEQAQVQVHIAFYIWLDDDTGTRMAQAVAAAARRGVQCRVMVDALGSRAFRRSALWRELASAGVQLLATLDDVSRLWHMAFSRVDLRDHRKLVVIDNRIGYCGSQNCADPAFRIKARFAPWIDLLLRCEGPVVRQMQSLFLSGWVPETGEDLRALLGAAPDEAAAAESACVAQVFETGPTARHNAMSDMFVASLYAARDELLITTPYFVPDESILRALCAAPRRGVRTTVIFPARSDSWLVGKACRSTYADLLEAGVAVHEYPLGLLHTKALTVDGELALVGSANMDRRSLELNYENNLLIADCAVAAQVRERLLGYLAVSRPVSLDAVRAWPFHVRLVQNVVGMMSPVL